MDTVPIDLLGRGSPVSELLFYKSKRSLALHQSEQGLLSEMSSRQLKRSV